VGSEPKIPDGLSDVDMRACYCSKSTREGAHCGYKWAYHARDEKLRELVERWREAAERNWKDQAGSPVPDLAYVYGCQRKVY
jgi:hypothetical protein